MSLYTLSLHFACFYLQLQFSSTGHSSRINRSCTLTGLMRRLTMVTGERSSGTLASLSAMSATAVLFCAMLLLEHGVTASSVVLVGGTGGWELGQNYNSGITVMAGDSLVFNYNKNEHNVVRVSANDFKSCIINRPLKTFSSGRDSIKLPRRGTYFYLCAIPGHCAGGMKLKVTVR